MFYSCCFLLVASTRGTFVGRRRTVYVVRVRWYMLTLGMSQIDGSSISVWGSHFDTRTTYAFSCFIDARFAK